MNCGRWNEVGLLPRTLKRDHQPFRTMKAALSLSLVLLLAMAAAPSAVAGGSEGGVDVNPESDAPFSVLERTTPSQDGASWALSVQLSEDAKENGTTAVITTQICLNNGVCDPPVNHDVSGEDGVYSMELTPPNDHSYVNWRVKATYADDSTENFPSADWYKTWSTCYYNDGEYGGVHAEGDGCNVPAAGETESALPALGLGLVVVTVGAALAIGVRRRA